MAITIPEQTLFNLIRGIFIHVKRDIDSAASDDKMLVYELFNGLTLGKRNLFTEAKDLFARDDNHPRQINTHMFYPKEQKGVPTVNIVLPGEQSMFNELGVGETGRVVDYVIDEDNSTATPKYLRRFDQQLVVLITSDNARETLLIYHLLKSMFISIFDASEFAGLQNPVLSGRDLAINEANTPPHLFTRALSIKTMHTVQVPRFFSEPDIRQVILSGRPVSTEPEA